MTTAGAYWSSRSIASSFQHKLFYLAIHLGGWRAAYTMLLPVVFYYSLKPSLRERSKPYLEKRFPAASPWMRFVHAFRLNLEFGKVLVDRAVLGITGQGKAEGSRQDKELLGRLLAEGRGLIILTAHIGSWQSAMASLDLFDAPVGVVYRRDPGDVDRLHFEHTGAMSPVQFIDPRDFPGAVPEMMNLLRRGGVLCIMGDRVLRYAVGSVEVQFLGKPAHFPFSAFRIASATGAPVAIMFSRRIRYGRSLLEVQQVQRVEPDKGRSAEMYLEYVQAFASALERFVVRHPYQFFNFFDMWQKGPNNSAKT